MKNKIFAFVMSLIITVISFLFILYIEEKIYNPNGTNPVYVVDVEKLDKNYIITEENFDNLFVLEERRSEQIPKLYVNNKEEIYNYYLKCDMYKNEILSLDKLISVDDELSKIMDPREITVNASSTDDVLGGKLRAGDRVDVLVTYKKANNIVTETRLEDIYISKTASSDGVEISRSNKDKTAQSITFLLIKSDAEELETCLALGTWKLAKVSNGE